MWPFSNHSGRRKDKRRTRVAAWRGTLLQRVPEDAWNLSTWVGVAAALAAAFIVNLGGPALNLRTGQTVPRALPARVELQIADEQATLELRVRERDRAPNHFRIDQSLLDDTEARLGSVLTLVRAAGADDQAVQAALRENKVSVDESGLRELRRLAELPDGGEFQQYVTAILTRLRAQPLVDPQAAAARVTPRVAVLFDPPQERSLPIAQLRFTNDTEAVTRTIGLAVGGVPEVLRASFARSLESILRIDDGPDSAVRPLYVFDSVRTADGAEAAAAAVPPQFRRYLPGDELADAGPLSSDERQLLATEHAAVLADPQRSAGLRAAALARGLLTVLIVLGVVAYVRRYQRRVFLNKLRWTASSVCVLGVLLAARLVYVELDVTPALGAGAQALAAAGLGILFPHGAVFAICSALALLISMAMQQGVLYLVSLLVLSGVLAYPLRSVRNRGKIVGVGLVSALVAFGCWTAVGVVEGQSWSYALRQAQWAAGAVALAGFVIEGILPGIERLFRFSTGMTLLEWCDASKPLLRLLAAEAPGTYNHSIMVGALAEAACDAIGANGLLARAGAYYHDIGKSNKPEYFVENQAPGVSRHERLSPAMSLLIIIGHVKDGLEMAESYSLPASLRPFIAEHHGTTLVEYFYHLANKSRRGDDPEVPDSSYRYPGPKPQSRETAVVMLCDSVEGAVRAMSEPTPARIEDVVSELIQKRLLDGQFDECDLTFRELARIRGSLVKSLCGIYHARIAYPEPQEPAEDEAEAPEPPPRRPSSLHAS